MADVDLGGSLYPLELRLEWASRLPEGLLIPTSEHPPLRLPFHRSELGARFCKSNKLPGDSAAFASEQHLEYSPALYYSHCICLFEEFNNKTLRYVYFLKNHLQEMP